jgi:chromosome partitioning protein
MRALWQWVESRLGSAVAATEEPVLEEFVEIPAIIPKWAALPSFDADSALFLRTPARV